MMNQNKESAIINNKLDTRKFDPLSICIGVISFLLGSFCLAVGGIITGIAGIIIGIKKKKSHRTAIGIAFSAVGTLLSLFFLYTVIKTGLNPDASMDYWLYRLLFSTSHMH